MKNFLSLSFLLLLIACGKHDVPKKVKVNFGSLKNVPATLTEVFVIGKNETTGDYFGFAYDELTEDGITLESGLWSFAAIGWDGVTAIPAPMTGNLRCDSTDAQLIESDTTINLSVTQLGCAEDLFGPASAIRTNNTPDPINIHNCIAWDGSSDPVNCSSSGHPQSYKITIHGFNTSTVDPENTLGSIERCINNAGVTNGTLGGISLQARIPLFDNEAPVPMSINTYSDSTCTTETGSYAFNGIATDTSSGGTFHYGNGRNDLVFSNTVATICSWGASNTPFAQGNYVAPPAINYICNATQLSQIGNAIGAHSAGNYQLMNDIDLTGVAWENFMIGTTATPYTGEFNGNDKAISNVTISAASVGTGLFGAVNGATIKNLTVNGSTTTSANASEHGGVIGRSSGNTTLSKITANTVNINGTNGYIGGIVGRITAGQVDYQYLTANNVVIAGGLDNLGGVIGLISAVSGGSKLKHLYSDDVLLSTGSSNKLSFGGVIGGATLSGIAEMIDLHGNNVRMTANTNEQYFGGVIGFMNTSTYAATLKNFSGTNVSFTDNIAGSLNQSIGGVIGALNGSAATLSHFKGDLTVVGDNIQYVGGLIGGYVSSNTFEYGSANINTTFNGSVFQTVGGAIGSIQDSANISKITTTGNIFGSTNLGGVIGFSNNAPTVSEVSSSVNITGSGDSIGGVAGQFAGFLSNAYQTGTVDGGTNGAIKVGGLVGRLYSQAGGAVTSSISLGTVTGNSPTSGVIGELVAGATACNNTCHYNNANTTNGGSVGTATGSTLTFLKTPANQAGINGLDFGSANPTWTVASSANTAPNLSWENLVNSVGGFHAGGLHDPWPISSATQWNTIAANTNYWSDISIMLANDISFGSTNGNFTMLGTTAKPFKGELFGNDHTMSNIKIDVATQYIGVISVADGVNINTDGKSLTLSGLDFTSTASFTRLAGLIGYVQGAGINTIKNVTVDSGTLTGAERVGGLIGEVVTHTHGHIFENLVNYATVTSTGTHAGGVFAMFSSTGSYTVNKAANHGAVSGTSRVGGVLGDYAAATSLIFNDSFNTGNVSGTGIYVGGFGGNINGSGGGSTFNRNYNIGTVTSTTGSVGGFAGFVSTNVTFNNNYNAGAVSSTEASPTGVGGFVGYLNNTTPTFNFNYNSGTVTANSGTDGFSGFGVPTNINGNVVLVDVEPDTPNGATTKTAPEMRQQSTFTNLSWDFSTIWTIDEGVSFPTLQ